MNSKEKNTILNYSLSRSIFKPNQIGSLVFKAANILRIEDAFEQAILSDLSIALGHRLGPIT